MVDDYTSSCDEYLEFGMYIVGVPLPSSVYPLYRSNLLAEQADLNLQGMYP